MPLVIYNKQCNKFCRQGGLLIRLIFPVHPYHLNLHAVNEKIIVFATFAIFSTISFHVLHKLSNGFRSVDHWCLLAVLLEQDRNCTVSKSALG